MCSIFWFFRNLRLKYLFCFILTLLSSLMGKKKIMKSHAEKHTLDSKESGPLFCHHSPSRSFTPSLSNHVTIIRCSFRARHLTQRGLKPLPSTSLQSMRAGWLEIVQYSVRSSLGALWRTTPGGGTGHVSLKRKHSRCTIKNRNHPGEEWVKTC